MVGETHVYRKNKKPAMWRVICPGEDLNLHPVKDTALNRARLPIPPPGLADFEL